MIDANASPPVPASAYVALDGGAYASTALTRGPWHVDHQHAGPPIALVARGIERAAAGLGLTHIARLAANLLRPIPIAELTLDVQTEYAGRNVAHFSARLMSGGKDVARFTAIAQREWICIDACTLLDSIGGGLAEARIFDTRGLIGRSTQSLAIRPRD